MKLSGLREEQAQWPQAIFAHPCVLLDESTRVQELLNLRLNPDSGGASGRGLVLKNVAETGQLSMCRALDAEEGLQHADWVVLHNPILDSPGNFDLIILFSILLRLKAGAHVAIVLDRGRIQGIGTWNALLEAGFVPVGTAGEGFVEYAQPVPAASLAEALERVTVQFRVSNPKLVADIGKMSWDAHFPGSLSEESAFAMSQHPDGAVRAKAILWLGHASGETNGPECERIVRK